MKCLYCKEEMVMGVAIEPKLRDASSRVMELNEILNVSELKIVSVYKCPKCGYSDDGYEK